MDYTTWKLQQLKDELNKEEDTILVDPKDPWVPYKYRGKRIKKEEYERLKKISEERDKKLIQNIYDREKKAKLAREKNSAYRHQLQERMEASNNLMNQLDRITARHNVSRDEPVRDELVGNEKIEEEYNDIELMKDLDEVYINHSKSNYMQAMIKYINYERFIQCHNEDMNKVESCLYELKTYLQTKDDLNDYENIILYTINCIIIIYESEDIDEINTVYTNWYYIARDYYIRNQSITQLDKSGGKNIRKNKFKRGGNIMKNVCIKCKSNNDCSGTCGLYCEHCDKKTMKKSYKPKLLKDYEKDREYPSYEERNKYLYNKSMKTKSKYYADKYRKSLKDIKKHEKLMYQPIRDKVLRKFTPVLEEDEDDMEELY